MDKLRPIAQHREVHGVSVDLPWRAIVGVDVLGTLVLATERTNAALCSSSFQRSASNARLVSPHRTPVSPGICL